MKRRMTIVLLIASLCAALLIRQLTVAAPPPPPPERLNDVIAGMNLTADQQQKVDAAIEDMHRKQQKARDELMQQLHDVLTPEQLRQLSDAMDRPAPPHRAHVNPTTAANLPKGTVIFTGGYETDPRDHGRPVVLVAAALGVPSDVFRTAFSGVKPAGAGEEPQPEQVRKNKTALMKVLEPYGVTNDKLDAASNAYRYNQGKGELWPNTPAKAIAVIVDGKVTGIKIINAGAGYSSAPVVSVAGFDELRFKVKLHFGTDVTTNGSIESVTMDAASAKSK